MDSTVNLSWQMKESETLKINQWKSSKLKNREKKDKRKINKTFDVQMTYRAMFSIHLMLMRIPAEEEKVKGIENCI